MGGDSSSLVRASGIEAEPGRREDCSVLIEGCAPQDVAGPRRLRAEGAMTALGGELLFGAVRDLLRVGCRELEVDLSATTELAPAAVAWLDRSRRLVEREGGELRVTGVAGDAAAGPGVDAADDAGSPERPPGSITVYPDGPLVVRGEVEIRDQHGAVLAPTGFPVALCRCGRSAVKPWCDGSHRLARDHAAAG